jgi:hypothetical protein
MKYCFTTLAVGEPYESKTKELFKDLREKTTQCDFFITTNNSDLTVDGERINVNTFSLPSLKCSKGGFDFHLNLKVLSLKHILQFEQKQETSFKKYDYVIFTDGDWGVHKDFSEKKIINMLDYMDRENVDFLFERPNQIGGSKLEPDQCFYKEKLYDYDVFDHNKWDEAHVPNEQFLVFKNNSKFRFFVQRWEMFLWYSIANDIRNYPDGFEIGVSALEAGMNYQYTGVFSNFIPSCFYFYTKGEDLHERF